jgi:transcriptional regulator of met regulon
MGELTPTHSLRCLNVCGRTETCTLHIMHILVKRETFSQAETLNHARNSTVIVKGKVFTLQG